jgi:hypothetical protein
MIDNSRHPCAIYSHDSHSKRGVNTEVYADTGEVMLLLKAMQSGDPAASEKLLPLVYNELHRLAES